MRGKLKDGVDIAYRLRHRLRQIGALLASHRSHGPLVTPRHAAYLLAVDESRVRVLMREGRLPVVTFAGGFRYIPAEALMQAPTPLEAGGPMVVREDGSRGRDAGGHDGLCLPLSVDTTSGLHRPKKMASGRFAQSVPRQELRR